MREQPKYTIVIDIFEHEQPQAVEPIKPVAKTINPIEELKNAAGPIEIKYSARYQNSATKAFMDFSKSDLRWLALLITDLTTIRVGSPIDAAIMQGTAVVRNRYNAAQTWQDIVEGMLQDKIMGGRDFSEGQMKQLSNLIGLLSKGKALAGCGSLVFVERMTGKALIQ